MLSIQFNSIQNLFPYIKTVHQNNKAQLKRNTNMEELTGRPIRPDVANPQGKKDGWKKVCHYDNMT